jgi:hypothetical protein
MEELAGVTAIDVRAGEELNTRRFVVDPCVRLPLIAVIVNVYAPVVAVAVATTVMFVDPEPVTVVGLNVAATPAGKPLTLKVVAPLNPPKPAIVVVKLVLLPWITFCELGAVVIEKSIELLTTRITVAVCTRVPAVPFTVSV